jgi:hypothetical protein
VFDAVTVGVMPLYALMMFRPRAAVTKALVGHSDWVFALGSLLHVSLLLAIAVLSGGIDVLQPLTSVRSASAGLALMSGLMRDSGACCACWVHLLLVDLYQARWIYADSIARGLPGALRVCSLALSFMVAPLGLLFHVVASRLVFFHRSL